MNLTFNPYEGDAGQYYSVREVLERLLTPLPENKLKRFSRFVFDIFRQMYKQKPLTDIERASYFEEETGNLPLVDVYPKGWLWNIVVFSIQLHPDFFYEE